MDTLGLRHIESNETIGTHLREQLWYWSLENHIPIHGGIELTEKCNFKCLHCFLEGRYEKQPLSADRIFDYLDQITDAGNLWLTLTGGEPLMRKDFDAIYTYAYQNGLLLLVFSNGFFLNEGHIALFKEKAPVTIEISIYGLSDAVYKTITGADRAWEKIKRNIMRCVSEKLPVFLKFIVLRENYTDILRFKDWVSELGVDYDISAPIHPGVFGDKSRILHRISPQHFAEIEMSNPQTRSAWEKVIQTTNQRPYVNDRLFRCNAGRNIFLISADARVHPCVLYRLDGMSLKTKAFKDIWADMANLHQRVRAKPLKCDGCRYRLGCPVCPAWAYLEHDDPESPLQFLCDAAKQINSYIRKEVYNGENHGIRSESGNSGNESANGRWRVQGAPTGGRELLQKVPSLRSYDGDGNERQLPEDGVTLTLGSFKYRQLGPFHLIINRSSGFDYQNGVLSVNNDAMDILNAISTPSTLNGLHQRLCESRRFIKKDRLKTFISGLINMGIINYE